MKTIGELLAQGILSDDTRVRALPRAYFNTPFLVSASLELDKVMTRAHVGEKPNPLEKFAIEILTEMAGYESVAGLVNAHAALKDQS